MSLCYVCSQVAMFMSLMMQHPELRQNMVRQLNMVQAELERGKRRGELKVNSWLFMLSDNFSTLPTPMFQIIQLESKSQLVIKLFELTDSQQLSPRFGRFVLI